MKKYWLLLLILPFLWFVSCPNDNHNNKKNDTTEEELLTDAKYELSGLTAAQYFAEKKLTLGWNVGDSLDGMSETGWSNPRISTELFEGVTGAGFNVLRIPITWHQNADRPIGPAPDYKLNKNRLDRVVKVVDMAYDAGFAAVIINIHHDGAPGHKNDGMFWLDMDGDSAKVTAQFSKVWEQIATQFKDYGDWLVFEGMNEPMPANDPGRWGWNATDAQFTTINEWNQAFTDAVRGTGGNNTNRFLVIQPISARAHVVMDARFKLPTDPTPNKQIVSVHWYYPEPFSLYGSSFTWDSSTDKNILINGSSSPNTGNVGFSHYKTKYTSQNIPMIIGECGATFQASRTGADLDTAKANRIAYLADLCEQAKANGLVPIIWDNGKIVGTRNSENFGLFNRSNGTPLAETADAITAMVNAVK
jgi:aryl-phospho-beta-D-glucosidase BglC (GH1 family)